MTVINPIWFYIISVVSKISVVFVITTIILATLLVALVAITFDIYSNYNWDEQGEVLLKAIKMVAIGTIVSGLLCVIIPNDKTIYKMLIAKNVTYENLDKAQEVIKDSVDYIFDKIDDKGDKNND